MIETRTVEIALEPRESSREAGRKRFLAAMSGELQGAFVTIPSRATAPAGATTDSRLDAVTQARMHLSSEGFVPSKESEDLARRFIAGEVDRIRFSGHRHADPSQDHA
ncbi:hypothetical protein [Dyella sp.]|uniref:hypothetical protein n=1 Tax=Dyella sp. TaxID=1869338 RepID=UPI002ED38F6F